jgi:crotonobetainyl-CoA:carnitine CoA-transferase CaiB-like acyl-CoA transferase
MEPNGPLALSGVRVLAIEQYGAGPWATLQLADLGADVIKIEDPVSHGDVGRYVPPFQSGEDSLFFEAFNRGKRSISLDLRHPDGQTVFHDLVRGSDALFCNLRGDAPAKLGLTYTALATVNPRIVCCSLSGYGMTGPRAAQGAYDYVIQGLAGWMSLTGDPDGPPTKSGLSMVDFSGGYLAAIALMAGLLRVRAEGVGCQCDISLHEVALALLNYVGTWTASRDFVPRRRADSAHQSIVPFQAFPTADGWIVVACAKQKFWDALCSVLNREDLSSDPRFADFAGRDHNRDELMPELYRAFALRTTSEWVSDLEAAGVPSGPVNDVEAALGDPQVLARETVVEIQHSRLGMVRHIASPLRIGLGVRQPDAAPERGSDIDNVLGDVCGYDAAKIAKLRREGVFGEP